MNALHRSPGEAGRITVLLLVAVFLSSCATEPMVPPGARSELTPTGKLRAAINLGNTVLAQKDPAGGEPRGVSVDLARELGRRLGVPIEFITYDAAGKVFDALKTGAWDIAFLSWIYRARATEISLHRRRASDLRGPYLVPWTVAARDQDVDRCGVRVAVGNKSAYDLYLTRTLKRAQLVRVPTSPGAIDIFLEDKLEAAAGVKQSLLQFAKTHPNVRVMDGRFEAIEQAMGTPKGREAGALYLRGFVEEMKASGFVARGLVKSGQGDATVAPRAPVQ